MPNATEKRTTPEFTFPVTENSQLGIALLIATNEEGDATHPVGYVTTLAEARAMAIGYVRDLRDAIERGEDCPLCPCEFTLWARGMKGWYVIAATFPA